MKKSEKGKISRKDNKRKNRLVWIFISTLIFVSIGGFIGSLFFGDIHERYLVEKGIKEVDAEGFNCILRMEITSPNSLGLAKHNRCAQWKQLEASQYLQNYTTLEDCKKAPKVLLCTFLLAREQNNLSICDTQIQGFEKFSQFCYYKFAVDNRNIDLCNKTDARCVSECRDYIKQLKENDKKNWATIGSPADLCEEGSYGQIFI